MFSLFTLRQDEETLRLQDIPVMDIGSIPSQKLKFTDYILQY